MCKIRNSGTVTLNHIDVSLLANEHDEKTQPATRSKCRKVFKRGVDDSHVCFVVSSFFSVFVVVVFLLALYHVRYSNYFSLVRLILIMKTFSSEIAERAAV